MTDPTNPYRNQRVVVLGASGFIGRWVARLLCRHGARVYAIVRNTTATEQVFAQYDIQAEIIEQDVQDLDGVADRLRAIQPAISFNLAGYGVDRSERDEAVAYRINTELVHALGTAVPATHDGAWPGRHLVHVGSALEYGDLDGNLAEDSVPCPTTLYGRTKLGGTEALRDLGQSLGIKGVTARLFTVYGPGEHTGRLLPSLLDTTRTGRPLDLSAGMQKRDFVYVEDVAEGLLRLGTAPTAPGEVINLATGRLTTVRHFVEIAAEVLQIPEDHLNFGALPTYPSEMAHGDVTTARLRHRTAWTPSVSIAEGVQKTFDFVLGTHEYSN